MSDSEPYTCACGESYPTEAELVQHDIQQHARDSHEAEQDPGSGKPRV